MSFKLYTLVSFLIFSTAYSQEGLSTADFEKAKEKYKDKNYKEALKFFDFAETYTPEQYVFFSKCYDRQRNFDKENKTLYTGLSKHKNSSLLYKTRADFFERMREYDFAIRDYGLAIKFAESDSMKYDCIGERSWTKFLMNDLEGSVADCKTILEHDSLSLQAHNVLGVVYDELGEVDLALKHLLISYEIDSTNTNLVSDIGFFYQNIEDYEASVIYFNKAIELEPNNGVAYSNLSYSKLKMGDVEGALEDVELSMELYPNNCYAYRNRALIYIKMGKMKKACKDIEISIGLGFTKTYGNEVVELQRKYCN